jgi:hypothetical protein
MGVISEEQLEQALTVQKESAEPLGTVLVACGCASRLAIQDALARQSGFSFEPEHGHGTGLRTKLVEGAQTRAADREPNCLTAPGAEPRPPTGAACARAGAAAGSPRKAWCGV